MTIDDAVDSYVEPDRFGRASAPDPWPDIDALIAEPGPDAQKLTAQAIGSWVDAMVTSQHQLLEPMTWFWHGHLVSGVDKVKSPAVMATQIARFRRLGLDGDFGTLLREITTDAAMLGYLDGGTSTSEAPNENYSRELLELFAIGIGHYTEADVAAGARALTGWVAPQGLGFDVADRRGGAATDIAGRFVPRRHDPSPSTYLGSSVDDVDSVVDAVLGHRECGPFVASRIARHLIGPGIAPEITAGWGAEFASDGYRLRPLIRSILIYGVNNYSNLTAEATGPVQWTVSGLRQLGFDAVPLAVLQGLRRTGQVPMAPPNVAGWPRGSAWYDATSMVARANLAVTIAQNAPGAAVDAAQSGDLAALADALAVPDGFGPATAAALESTTDPTTRLATALLADEVIKR